VSFDDEELPQAGSPGVRRGAAGGGGGHAAGDAPGAPRAGPRAAQGAGWERELLQLAALLPPALRDALLAHERFLEARRQPAPDQALLPSALGCRQQRPRLWHASSALCRAPPGQTQECRALASLFLAGRWAKAPHALAMRTCCPSGNMHARFARCLSRRPSHGLARGSEDRLQPPLGWSPCVARAPRSAGGALRPQVLEVVMDVGRPPLARIPAGDVRLSEAVITYADLDTAVAKVCSRTYSSPRACVLARGRAVTMNAHSVRTAEWPAARDGQLPADKLVCLCA